MKKIYQESIVVNYHSAENNLGAQKQAKISKFPTFSINSSVNTEITPLILLHQNITLKIKFQK